MTFPKAHQVEPTFMHPSAQARLGAFETVSADASGEARALVPRVIAAYRRAMDEFRAPARSMWDDIQGHNSDFCAALQDGDEEAVFGFLRAMFQSNLIWGLGFVAGEVTRTAHDREHYLRLLTDSLVSLAECAGHLRAKCIEQEGPDPWLGALDVDLDDVVRALGPYGVDVAFPRVAAAYGSTLGGQFVTVDSVVQSAIVWRLRQLGAGPASTIVEIGGGYGCHALKAHQAGLRCRIYDLPWVNAVQGYFLGLGAGAANVSLFGEGPAAIEIRPHWRLSELPDRSVDFALSANALAEMGHETALGYLRQIDRFLRGSFLSVGQEAETRYREIGPQNRVLALVRHTERLHLVSRQPWWMRQGYVEEVFAVPRPTLLGAIGAVARKAPLVSRGVAARAYHSRIGKQLFGPSRPAPAGHSGGRAIDLAPLHPATPGVYLRVGSRRAQDEVCPTLARTHHLQVPAGSAIEVDLGRRVEAGYDIRGGEPGSLPPGSSLDAAAGRFVWRPPLSWLGRYDLVFTAGGERIDLVVTLADPADARDLAVHLDTPLSQAVEPESFVVAGWALDPRATTGAGVVDLTVTAHRTGSPEPAQFSGVAVVGGVRPDVAAAFGDQFEAAGFTLTVPRLPSGAYELRVRPRPRRTGASAPVTTVRLAVPGADYFSG
jgi:hypothetical protein